MTKINRATQEIFANKAGSNQITAFGTAKSNTPTYTTDLAQIQNTNFLYGWTSALLTDNAPWEEDTNGLFYAITRQLAYLFQEGIPEYDPNTNYSLNALCKGIGTNVIYCSLIADNLGNPLSNPDYWQVYISGGAMASYEIGLPQMTLSNNLYPNEIWLEGQEVSRTLYKNLYNIYGTTYGAGDGSTTFNLPDCRNRVFWGAQDFGYISAGLPNITGTTATSNDLNSYKHVFTGAFSWGYDDTSARCANDQDGRSVARINFNASNSNSIYGNSNTVQPPAIKARFKTRFE